MKHTRPHKRPHWRNEPIPTRFYMPVPDNEPPRAKVPVGVWVFAAFFFILAAMNFLGMIIDNLR